MISLLIYIIVMAAIFGVVWYVLRLIPLPPPFPVIIQVVMAVIFLLIVLNMLVPFDGGGLTVGHPLVR